MNLLLNLQDYNKNNICFGEKQKNTIIWNSFFIKIIYSTEELTMNGLFFKLDLEEIKIIKDYNKFKISFNVPLNIDIVQKIELIEKTILHKISITNKTPRLSIYEQFKNGLLKINLNNDILNEDFHLILKISGIWENANEYGLTFKFLLSNRLSNNNSRLSA